MKVKFVLRSGNVKTGKMPVTTSPKETCPVSCPLKGAGCYAELGHTNIHWKKVSETGMEWEQFLHQIQALPEGQLWRHNQAGDLAGDGIDIDGVKLKELTKANRGRKGFTYTHYRGTENFKKVAEANALGFTVNLSADSPDQVDELVGLGVGPVVTVLPKDFSGFCETKGGNKIITCPAVTGALANCKQCGICQTANRSIVIGFPAHGIRKNKITDRLRRA